VRGTLAPAPIAEASHLRSSRRWRTHIHADGRGYLGFRNRNRRWSGRIAITSGFIATLPLAPAALPSSVQLYAAGIMTRQQKLPGRCRRTSRGRDPRNQRDAGGMTLITQASSCLAIWRCRKSLPIANLDLAHPRRRFTSRKSCGGAVSLWRREEGLIGRGALISIKSPPMIWKARPRTATRVGP
jgi:hypothetical protein